MKVVDWLDARRQNWRELEQLCARMEMSLRRIDGPTALRFSALYRSACADLALADAYQLPQHTIDFLHHLVGRAHNQLYPAQRFDLRSWWRIFLVEAPYRILRDRCVWLAAGLFWGFFLICMALAYIDQDFAWSIVSPTELEAMDQMYAEPIWESRRSFDQSSFMSGFYVQHNASIGIRCFVFGVVFGFGGLIETLSNACVLGTVFGHMARSDYWENFFHFVTAHGPFELTAIVLAAGAGMRMGFSLVDTGGRTRVQSLILAGWEALPTVFVAIALFILAAGVEAFISPMAPPQNWPWTPVGATWYWAVKFPTAVASSLALFFYIVVLGIRGRAPRAIG